ncbi:hypothetical protein F5Y15DRAFT_290497 [Xylariaceae sp. FL0016]|nr:hypothetical protein F5Y15DRAFT_290497 [Xylariaceae sp. FL0016]
MPAEQVEKILAAGEQNVWKRLLAFTCVISLVVSAFTIFQSQIQYGILKPKAPLSWTSATESLMKRSTVDALANDELLRRNWMAIVEFGADTSDLFADRFGTEGLKTTRDILHQYRGELFASEEKRRSSPLLAKRFPGLFDFLNPNKDDATGTDDTSADTSGLDPLGAIGDLFNQAASGLGDAILGDMAGVGMFVGVGVGEGAAQGLNLTTAENAKAIGAKVLAAHNMDSSGLNPTFENVGMGATASLLGAVDLSSLGGGLDLGPTIMSLASGIGTGAVNGLKIAAPTPPNGTDVPAIAGMFGFGLANSVAGSIDPSALASGATGDLTAQLPSAVLSLAQGMGNGALTGLKIHSIAPPSGTEVSELAGSFGFGLTQAVTSNMDISQLSSGTGGLDTTMLMQMLPAAASGLGKGLGEGIPVGLGVQSDPGVIATRPMPDGQIDVGGLTENFAMGLTSRLLANDTFSKLMSSEGDSTGLVSNIDFQSVAGGLARGLLQGATDSINSMGGVQALIDGTVQSPSGAVNNTLVQFNDSVNGAAVGFGQGFGSQGVLVAQSLIGKIDLGAQKRDKLPNTKSRALLDPRQEASTPSVVISNDSTVINISALINADGLSSITQKGVDLLTCRGVGGLGLILTSVFKNSGNSKSGDDLNVTQFKDFLPQGSVKFASEGHNYEINTQAALDKVDDGVLAAASAMKINGHPVPSFIVFVASHIIIGLLAFLSILPLALGLESTRNILIRLQKSFVLPNIPRWTNILWLGVLAPSIPFTLLFGALVMGNASHFRTAHGILGLLTLLLAIPAIALHCLVKARPTDDAPAPLRLAAARNITNQLLLLFAALSSMTGFADLSSIAICLTQLIPFELALSLGFGLSSVFTMASAVCSLDGYLVYRDRRKRRLSIEKRGSSREKLDSTGA